MSKRKPPTTSKKPGKGKMAAKAKHAIIKSPKRSHIPLAAEDDPDVETPKSALRGVHGLAEREKERFEESSNDNHAAAKGADASALRHPNGLKQEAHAAEISGPPHGRKLSHDERKGFDVFSVPAAGYQAKLLEISNANISLAFEFTQRLARVRSPVEFIAASSEFTGKRIAMFLRHSKEMGEIVLRRSLFG
jgi:hypothetical protein